MANDTVGRVNRIEIKPLTPELGGDFLCFFDHDPGAAFADTPERAPCA